MTGTPSQGNSIYFFLEDFCTVSVAVGKIYARVVYRFLTTFGMTAREGLEWQTKSLAALPGGVSKISLYS